MAAKMGKSMSYTEMTATYGERLIFHKGTKKYVFEPFKELGGSIGYGMIGKETDIVLFPPNVNGVPHWVISSDWEECTLGTDLDGKKLSDLVIRFIEGWGE